MDNHNQQRSSRSLNANVESVLIQRLPVPENVQLFDQFEELSKIYAIDSPFVARTQVSLAFGVFDGRKLQSANLLDDEEDGDMEDANEFPIDSQVLQSYKQQAGAARKTSGQPQQTDGEKSSATKKRVSGNGKSSGSFGWCKLLRLTQSGKRKAISCITASETHPDLLTASHLANSSSINSTLANATLNATWSPPLTPVTSSDAISSMLAENLGPQAFRSTGNRNKNKLDDELQAEANQLITGLASRLLAGGRTGSESAQMMIENAYEWSSSSAAVPLISSDLLLAETSSVSVCLMNKRSAHLYNDEAEEARKWAQLLLRLDELRFRLRNSAASNPKLSSDSKFLHSPEVEAKFNRLFERRINSLIRKQEAKSSKANKFTKLTKEQSEKLIELTKNNLNHLIDAQLLLRNKLASEQQQAHAQNQSMLINSMALIQKGREYELLLKNNFNLLKIWQNLEETKRLVCFVSEPIKANLGDLFWFTRKQYNIFSGHGNYIYTQASMSQSHLVSPQVCLDSLQVKRGLLQILEALNYLHTICKLIHRNLTPSNILINALDNWKLSGLDFAIRFESTTISESASVMAHEFAGAPATLLTLKYSAGAGSHPAAQALRRQRTLHQTKCQEIVRAATSAKAKHLNNVAATTKKSPGKKSAKLIGGKLAADKLQPEVSYLAPEIWRLAECSHKSDMFSFGLILGQTYDFGRHRAPLSCLNSNGDYESELKKLEERGKRKLARLVPFEMRQMFLEMLEPEPNCRPSANYALQLFKRPIELCKTNEDSLRHLKSSLAFLDASKQQSQQQTLVPPVASQRNGHNLPGICGDFSGSSSNRQAARATAACHQQRPPVKRVSFFRKATARYSAALASRSSIGNNNKTDDQEEEEKSALERIRRKTRDLQLLNLLLHGIDATLQLACNLASGGSCNAPSGGATNNEQTAQNKLSIEGLVGASSGTGCGGYSSKRPSFVAAMNGSGGVGPGAGAGGLLANNGTQMGGGLTSQGGSNGVPFSELRMQFEFTLEALRQLNKFGPTCGASVNGSGVTIGQSLHRLPSCPDSRTLLLSIALHRRLLDQVARMRLELPQLSRLLAAGSTVDRPTQNHRQLAELEERLHQVVSRQSLGSLAPMLSDPMLKLDEFLLLHELVQDLVTFLGHKCRQNFALRGKQLLNELTPLAGAGCLSSSSSEDDDDEERDNLHDLELTAAVANLSSQNHQSEYSDPVDYNYQQQHHSQHQIISNLNLAPQNSSPTSSGNNNNSVAVAGRSAPQPARQLGGATSMTAGTGSGVGLHGAGNVNRMSNHRYSDYGCASAPDDPTISYGGSVGGGAARSGRSPRQSYQYLGNSSSNQMMVPNTTISITAPSPMGSMREVNRASADSLTMTSHHQQQQPLVYGHHQPRVGQQQQKQQQQHQFQEDQMIDMASRLSLTNDIDISGYQQQQQLQRQANGSAGSFYIGEQQADYSVESTKQQYSTGAGIDYGTGKSYNSSQHNEAYGYRQNQFDGESQAPDLEQQLDYNDNKGHHQQHHQVGGKGNIVVDKETEKSRSKLIDELLKTINDDNFEDIADLNNKYAAFHDTQGTGSGTSAMELANHSRPKSAIDGGSGGGQFKSRSPTGSINSPLVANNQQQQQQAQPRPRTLNLNQHRPSGTPSTFDNVIRRMSTNIVQNFNKMSGTNLGGTGTGECEQQSEQLQQLQASDQLSTSAAHVRREKSSNYANSLYVDNQVPARRHSDNTINIPRIQVALSSPSASHHGGSKTNLNQRASVSASKLANKWKLTAKTNQRESSDKLSPNLSSALGYMRRHSSGNTTGNDKSNGHSSSTHLNLGSSPFKTKSSSNLGLDFLLSNRSMKRRCSAASMLGHQTQRRAENLIDAGMKSVQNMFG